MGAALSCRPPAHRTGGFLKKRMTTIYVDSRKRVAGSDSDFEVDLGESLRLQSDGKACEFQPAELVTADVTAL